MLMLDVIKMTATMLKYQRTKTIQFYITAEDMADTHANQLTVTLDVKSIGSSSKLVK